MRNSIAKTRHVVFPRPVWFNYYIRRKKRIKPIAILAAIGWVDKKAASGTWVDKAKATI